MAVSGNETFTFMWRIQNFSMCPEQFGEDILSPSFVVDFLEETEWEIVLYPRGDTNKNYISCYLRRVDNHEAISIGFSLQALSVHTDKIVKREFASHMFDDDMYGSNDFIHRVAVFDSTIGMLPNDTLTIKCCLWAVDKKPNITDAIVANVVNNSCESEAYSKNYCSFSTLIQMRSKSILWPIKSFSALQPNVKLTRTVLSPLQDKPSIDITVYLNGNTAADQSLQIDIRNKSRIDVGNDFFIRGKIKTFGSLKENELQEEDEYYFRPKAKDDVWRFPTFIKMKDLRNQKYLCYTDDTLYLFCEFHYSVPDLVCEFKEENFNFPVYHSVNLNCFNCAKDEYLSLYRSGKYSDATLQVGSKTFKVHKNILGLKSDVFSAMFESDMQESATGIVKIDDFDPDTVDRLLNFLYTETLESLEQENVLKLYSIADKYNVVSLKCRCRCILMSTLIGSNVCRVLALADAHQDEELLEAARWFIRMNSDQIFSSPAWKDFTKNNTQLSANIMLYILSKNFLS